MLNEIEMYLDLLKDYSKCEESKRIMKRYPDRIPIICTSLCELQLEKNKFLAPRSLTIFKFVGVIQQSLNTDKQLYMICKGTKLRFQSKIDEIYEKYKEKDGFLYFEYVKDEEN